MFRDFNFDIAPAAARKYCLRQNIELRLFAASKQASTLPAAAGRDQRGGEPLSAQPADERVALLRTLEVVETQLQRSSRFESKTQLGNHLPRQTGSNHPADAVLPERPLQVGLPSKNSNVWLYHAGDNYVKRHRRLS